MGCAHKENQDGFTLVEISIVMIIIGLLIGGTFGGMKLVEISQSQSAVRDLKALELGALTFKDTYGRLPGDIVNPAARLPNCTVAPCATGGNGDRRIGGIADGAAITAADEEFVFWQHLFAANLISNVKPVADLTSGEGQPENPVGGTYRMLGYRIGVQHFQNINGKHIVMMTDNYSEPINGATTQTQNIVPCDMGRRIDLKIDDGKPLSGKVVMWGDCTSSASLNADYVFGPIGSSLEYNLAF